MTYAGQCSRCDCLQAMLKTVVITSLPHAVMFLHRQCKIVLAFFVCVHTFHCKLMFNVLLGNSIKNLCYCFSGFSLQIGLYMFLFLEYMKNEPAHTHTSPLPSLCKAEVKFSPFSLTSANGYRPKFWGHQKDIDVIKRY